MSIDTLMHYRYRPIVVGAGPSGLAVAASLHQLSVPAVVVEKSDGIASLWRHHTYDRLNLHLPKAFCQLPHLPFPAHFPAYLSRDHFLDYLHAYSAHFSLCPLFSCEVVDARFDRAASLWRVTIVRRSPHDLPVVEHLASPWLVVATGENAEAVWPEVKGLKGFEGSVLHSSEYKSGKEFKGKKVLVVGCGNSGMEICVDLCDHGALPFLSVRNEVHVLPRKMLGVSTFGLAMKLLQWLPTRMVDKFLVIMAKMIIGDTEKFGLKRPKAGPLELKNTIGKTPVLDVGACTLIKNSRIKIVREVEALTSTGARFVDGGEMEFDSVIFATGYRTNLPSWLKDTDLLSAEGKPKNEFPSGCQGGEGGIYFVGFSGKGLLGSSTDAIKTAVHISEACKKLSKNKNKDILPL
ncbi:indole-3-pyruvate monooxygenase YUCCA8-like [Curcuma longa]|uniref:indole-3-pyruvate monooxygenase YUCCA8-like n=1 Tax=Curcuma longa TaxID=136217 RepID=UPI003D9DDA70